MSAIVDNIGIILIIIGSVGNNLGNNLVSLGHAETAEKEASEKTKSNKADISTSKDDIYAFKEEHEQLDPSFPCQHVTRQGMNIHIHMYICM